MNQKSYHTIDPLIMETLHLNEKRIHHIFDILHGKDVQEQTDQSYVAHYQKKSNNQKINPIEYHKKAKSPRLDTSLFIKQVSHRQRASSVKRLYSPSNRSQVSKSPQKNELKRLIESRKSAIIRHEKNIKNAQEIDDKKSQKPFKNKNDRLYMDYGQNRRSKTQQINPKDVYRLQTENLLSKLIYIEDIENSEKQMRRLKRRYKHLQRFDRDYYSKLNQVDLLLI